MNIDFTSNKKIRNIFHIYTDGACSGNPGPGGWSVIILNDADKVLYKTSNGQLEDTTNNRMELTALLEAFKEVDKYYNRVPQNGYEDKFIIYSDSAYAISALTDWCKTWANNGWKTANGKKPIKNSDLIFPLYKYYNKYFYQCQLVKITGHSGNVGNELADAAAKNDSKKFIDILLDNKIELDECIGMFDLFYSDLT